MGGVFPAIYPCSSFIGPFKFQREKSAAFHPFFGGETTNSNAKGANIYLPLSQTPPLFPIPLWALSFPHFSPLPQLFPRNTNYPLDVTYLFLFLSTSSSLEGVSSSPSPLPSGSGVGKREMGGGLGTTHDGNSSVKCPFLPSSLPRLLCSLRDAFLVPHSLSLCY